MNTGQSQWTQSRTVPTASVAGWTSLAGGGNTASAGPFSQLESMWLSHFRSWEIVVPRNLNVSTAATVLSMMVSGARAGGFHLKSTIISTVLRVFSSRLLRLHQTASCSTSCLYADSVFDEADDCSVIHKLQELDRRILWSAVSSAVGRERNPEGRQCWWWEFWMWVCPASLAAACPSGSWWATDRWRWAQRAVSPVCSVGKLKRIQQGSSDVLQVGQDQSLKWLHDHRRESDRGSFLVY